MNFSKRLQYSSGSLQLISLKKPNTLFYKTLFAVYSLRISINPKKQLYVLLRLIIYRLLEMLRLNKEVSWALGSFGQILWIPTRREYSMMLWFFRNQASANICLYILAYLVITSSVGLAICRIAALSSSNQHPLVQYSY